MEALGSVSIDPADWRRRSAEIHRLTGLSLVICAVGLFMTGIQLLVTCKTVEDTQVYPNTIGCAYPFQVDGFVLFYLAILFAIVAGNVFAHSPALGPIGPRTTFNRGAGSFLAAVIILIVLAAVASTLHLG